MAHLVCITGGLTGMLNASLALVEQLEQAGHRITYASPADLREPVTAQGISYIQLDPWVMQSGDPPISRWQKFWTLRERQQRAVDALGLQRFGQTIQELSADLVLIDMEMNPHIMAAVGGQFPVVLLCQFLSIWRRPQLPPIHTDIVPGQGWRGQSLAIEWSWLRYSWRKWVECQRERWRRMGLDRLSVLQCYAEQIGYPFRERFGRNQWLVPYPHGPLPILCLNALELDFPHDPHPLMHYVGPMVAENRYESRVDLTTDQTLAQIFENRRTSGRPLIYCACSTFLKADQRCLQQIVAAVSNSPHWDLVLGLGGQLAPDQLGPLPPNIHAFHWVPQVQVLKHADCVINNGGINSINESIYCGVPMLIYSLRRFDQNGNAARVATHGLGIVGDPVRDQAEQVRHHIQTLLTDPVYQTRVSRMRDCFFHYSHEKSAAHAIEALLNRQEQKERPRELTTLDNLSPTAITSTQGAS